MPPEKSLLDELKDLEDENNESNDNRDKNNVSDDTTDNNSDDNGETDGNNGTGEDTDQPNIIDQFTAGDLDAVKQSIHNKVVQAVAKSIKSTETPDSEQEDKK